MTKINELRDYLLENYVDEQGDLDIRGLDFSEFSGDIYVNRMKVKGDLIQSEHDVKGDLVQDIHKVGGDLFQDIHKVGGDLFQGEHDVKGDLIQGEHDVKGNYYSTNINVSGEITFQKPIKEITVEELEKLGYKIKEEEK